MGQIATSDKSHGMRVVMIVTGFPSNDQPNNGIFNLRAARALSRLLDVKVIHLRSWKPGRRNIEFSSFENIPVITLALPQVPSWSSFNIVLYRAFGWFPIQRVLQSCDLIHSVDAAFAGVLASTWARRANAYHIAHVVGSDINSILPKIHARRSIMGWEQHLHGVVCNSEATAKAFLRLYPRARNVRTFHRGVDLYRYHPNGTTTGTPKKNSSLRFLYLGGFPSHPDLKYGTDTKGGETLLKAWKEAEQNLSPTDVSLVIAGPGADAQRITRWRAGLRNPNSVYLSGVIHPESVPAYIRSSDVVLIPSMQEGLPNVAMEASACARPVFGSDVGGIPEVVVNGETGLILPPGDVKAWKNALIEYTTRVFELRVMGNQARQRMERLFDSKGYAAKLVDLYATALCEPLIPNHYESQSVKSTALSQ